MKGAIANLTKIRPNTALASDRIAEFLVEVTGYDLIDRPGTASNDYDIVLNINGPTAFCDIRQDIADMVEHATYHVFVQNDYKLKPLSQVRKVFRRKKCFNPNGSVRWPNLWTTVPNEMMNKHDRYFNWNCLAYRPLDNPLEGVRAPGLMYYGAYRKERMDRFYHYFELAPYDIYVSTTERGFQYFDDIDPQITWLPKFKNLITDLQDFDATLYVEDPYSNDNYCSPATRFYECLSAGVAVLVDEPSRETLKKGGYDVDDYVVTDYKDVEMLLKEARDIAVDQNLRWGGNSDKDKLAEQVIEALKPENLEPFPTMTKAEILESWIEDVT